MAGQGYLVIIVSLIILLKLDCKLIPIDYDHVPNLLHIKYWVAVNWGSSFIIKMVYGIYLSSLFYQYDFEHNNYKISLFFAFSKMFKI